MIGRTCGLPFAYAIPPRLDSRVVRELAKLSSFANIDVPGGWYYGIVYAARAGEAIMAEADQIRAILKLYGRD